MDDEQQAQDYAAVTDPRVLALLDVLAPVWRGIPGEDRIPIFEWAHEATPTAGEMIDLAEQLIAAIDGVQPTNSANTTSLSR